MGRYYSGDIEGKFWFAVQSSDAADRFGVMGENNPYINYYFNKLDHLKLVQEELEVIENTITKENLEKLNNFFENNNGYNNEILKSNNLLKIWEKHKNDYADYTLGKKIENCLIEKGYCEFQAEI